MSLFVYTPGCRVDGDQESTTGVPFPYNAEKFPELNSKAKNTDGEKNFNKYKADGNEQSVRHKFRS